MDYKVLIHSDNTNSKVMMCGKKVKHIEKPALQQNELKSE